MKKKETPLKGKMNIFFLNKEDGIIDWNKEHDVLTFSSLSICKSIWWTDAEVTRDINKSYSETLGHGSYSKEGWGIRWGNGGGRETQLKGLVEVGWLPGIWRKGFGLCWQITEYI